MKLRLGERNLGYASVGSGKALVLLHAFPLDRRMWQETAATLAGEYRVITPDLRGFGASDLGIGEVSIAGMADDMVALLDALAIERAVVGGLSMGGYVALAFAAKYPERLAGIVLADTRATADSDTARAGRAAALAFLAQEGVAAYAERQIANLLSPGAGEAVRSQVRSIAGAQRREAVAAGIQALRDRPSRQAELANIRCPALLLVGEEDTISPPAEMADTAAAIPGSRLVTIAQAGHLANLENPAAFASALAGFPDPAHDQA